MFNLGLCAGLAIGENSVKLPGDSLPTSIYCTETQDAKGWIVSVAICFCYWYVCVCACVCVLECVCSRVCVEGVFVDTRLPPSFHVHMPTFLFIDLSLLSFSTGIDAA